MCTVVREKCIFLQCCSTFLKEQEEKACRKEAEKQLLLSFSLPFPSSAHTGTYCGDLSKICSGNVNACAVSLAKTLLFGN